ncbi:MAG: alpha-amylase family glycosyl hydrolase, partial [Pseudomonadota bacterium]|nr:alpha-amylase family glycosyl hydrolase [Pseudomonadota bacterium]
MLIKRILGVGFIGALLSASALAATPPEQSGGSNAILLQGFHWNSASYSGPNWYGNLQNNAADIKAMGFTHVWFPPPSDAGSKEGYLPRQLNVLNSSYGSANDLTNAVHALTNIGVKAVVDVVVNHRVGTTGWSDFTNPSWSRYSITNNDECNCGLGNADTGDGYGSARDLDHTNVGEVQNGITGWLNNVLKPVGFSGIRYDFVKGYNPSYAGQYANAFNAEFCVGELWNNLDLNNVDAHRQGIMN